MLNVNRKNCYVTQRIGVGLKMMERCSIDKTCLIEYNWVQSHIRVYRLINNKDRCLGITLQVKYKSQLIVRLKAIEFREFTFCYLSSYLHCSFFWHLVIIYPLYYQVIKPMRRLLVISLHHRIVYRYRIIKALSCYNEASGDIEVSNRCTIRS